MTLYILHIPTGMLFKPDTKWDIAHYLQIIIRNNSVPDEDPIPVMYTYALCYSVFCKIDDGLKCSNCPLNRQSKQRATDVNEFEYITVEEVLE